MTKKKVKKKFLSWTTGVSDRQISSTLNKLEIDENRKELILSNFFSFTDIEIEKATVLFLSDFSSLVQCYRVRSRLNK
jgi:hypothetical protein